MEEDLKLEKKLLLFSAYSAAFISVIAIVIGLLINSQMILFDGLYSIIGVVLSLFSYFAAKFMNKKEHKKYPFGKSIVEPLVVIVQYTIIMILLTSSTITSFITILNGGNEIELGIALIYTVFVLIVCFSMYIIFKRYEKKTDSNLLKAETNQWLMDTWVTLSISIAFTIAYILSYYNILTKYIVYIDSLLVIIACILFIKVPIIEIKNSLKEVLDMSPEKATQVKVENIIENIQDDFSIDDWVLRMTKSKKMLWVEVDFIVKDKSKVQTIKDQDIVRTKLDKELDSISKNKWLTVAFTQDEKWTAY